MGQRSVRRTVFAFGVSLALIVSAGGGIALASTSHLSAWQRTASRVMRLHPDAVRVNASEISWEHGRVHLYRISGSVGTRSISNCTSKGSVFCFYDSSGYSGGILATFAGGGWHDSSGIGSVGSEYNNWSHSAFVHKSDQNAPEICDPPNSGDGIAPYAHPQWLYLANSQDTC
jgi:hypothetical protein